MKYAGDLGNFFVLGKAESPLFVSSYSCIFFKNTSGRSAVVFCACELIQFYSVMFCVARAVYKFDFRLVINATPNKLRPMERRSCMLMFFERMYIFLSNVASVKGLDLRCKDQLHSL
jgi:hypothetical protein